VDERKKPGEVSGTTLDGDALSLEEYAGQVVVLNFFDPAGRTLLAFHGTLNPSAIPSTVVLDQQGRVAASILGEVPSKRTLVELVRDVAK
jgi:hypothetical protein